MTKYLEESISAIVDTGFFLGGIITIPLYEIVTITLLHLLDRALLLHVSRYGHSRIRTDDRGFKVPGAYHYTI